ncbi:hypothetical protein, partial [Pseudomonas sp. RW409]|uniref:hypothetical protein n=1 Tax=Pseudomonas sp. RW409 TaxID=2202895 RepID=UPI001C47E51C
MTWQKIRMSSNGFIVTLWLTAERFIAAFSRSGTSFHLENHIAWFYAGCAADRRLRQRLQGPRCLCSRCRACEAANGNAVAAKPESAICLENHIAWFDAGCGYRDRDACVAAAKLARLRTATQLPQNLSPRSAWKTTSPGFTPATPPIAACGSGYKDRDACVAAAELARLRTATQLPQNLSPRSAWKTTSPGFTTATPPIAACGSGYRDRDARVAAAELARLRTATQLPQNLSPRSAWKTTSPGFTTATPPIAGYASGYRDRDACVAAAELARLRTATQLPQNLSPRSAWKTTSPGFTTATPPIAGYASGYRDRDACVAAAELARLRTATQLPQNP